MQKEKTLSSARLQKPVIIIGAGPVGMVCALALYRAGIKVTVLEMEAEPIEDQRAVSIHPPTCAMLDALGIAEQILPFGLQAPKYQYHDLVSGEMVAEFDLGQLKDELRFPYVFQYEQYKLTRYIIEQFHDGCDFDVRFLRRVTDIEFKSDSVVVHADSPDGPERYECTYLVGADGAHSIVRRSANIPFEGFTYPEHFIKIATHHDFLKNEPTLAYRNYFSDPNEWYAVFKAKGEHPSGIWRGFFQTRAGESIEDALKPEAVQQRLQKFFARQGEFELDSVKGYSVHQRVAATFRKERAILIGDAAHLNNPIGGIGMNGGIHDAINLCEKLVKVLRGEADEDLLDRYSRQRRKAQIDYVQAQTIRNKQIMEERDPLVRQRNLDELRRAAEDPEKAKSFMRRAALVDSLKSAALVA